MRPVNKEMQECRGICALHSFLLRGLQSAVNKSDETV